MNGVERNKKICHERNSDSIYWKTCFKCQMNLLTISVLCQTSSIAKILCLPIVWWVFTDGHILTWADFLNTEIRYSNRIRILLNTEYLNDDDVPPSKFEDEHDLRLNLRLSLRALGFCLLDPIVLI